MSIYYAVASLPTLALDREPGVAPDAFVRLCVEQVGTAEGAIARDLLEAGESAAEHAFAREWREREALLRNAIARARAARQGRDPAPWLREARGVDVGIERRVADAFGRATPEERERELDRIRWDLLDELAGLDPFTVRALLAYALKLRLARRWSGLDADRGAEQMESAVDALARGAM